MIVPFILLFFILGWRAKNISRGYYIWIVLVAGFAVIILTNNEQRAANRLGYRLDFKAMSVAGVWFYYSALILVGFLAGGWLGIRRRYSKLINSKSANDANEEAGF